MVGHEQIQLFNPKFECESLISGLKNSYSVFKACMSKVDRMERVESNPSARIKAALCVYADSLHLNSAVKSEINAREDVRKELWENYVRYNKEIIEEKKSEILPETEGSNIAQDQSEEESDSNELKPLQKKYKGRKWKSDVSDGLPTGDKD